MLKPHNFVILERLSKQILELYLPVRHGPEPCNPLPLYLFISINELVQRPVNLVVNLLPDLLLSNRNPFQALKINKENSPVLRENRVLVQPDIVKVQPAKRPILITPDRPSEQGQEGNPAPDKVLEKRQRLVIIVDSEQVKDRACGPANRGPGMEVDPHIRRDQTRLLHHRTSKPSRPEKLLGPNLKV